LKFNFRSFKRIDVTEEELKSRRKAYNEAHRQWKKDPNEATKTVMKAAYSSYNTARTKAKLPPARPVRFPPPNEHPLVTEARERKNEALRAMYAEPSSQAKKACLDADNEYKKLRRQHDPEYRAKEIEAVKRAMAKRKLGFAGNHSQ
jgi:hypothetical protein